jgi:hypothetical protein
MIQRCKSAETEEAGYLREALSDFTRSAQRKIRYPIK